MGRSGREGRSPLEGRFGRSGLGGRSLGALGLSGRPPFRVGLSTQILQSFGPEKELPPLGVTICH